MDSGINGLWRHLVDEKNFQDKFCGCIMFFISISNQQPVTNFFKFTNFACFFFSVFFFFFYKKSSIILKIFFLECQGVTV